MAKIVDEIDSCSRCRYFHTTPEYTEDSWERPETWWCTHKDVVPIGEKRKEIASYVEWRDKIDIPNWCPLCVKSVIKENNQPINMEIKIKTTVKITEDYIKNLIKKDLKELGYKVLNENFKLNMKVKNDDYRIGGIVQTYATPYLDTTTLGVEEIDG